MVMNPGPGILMTIKKPAGNIAKDFPVVTVPSWIPHFAISFAQKKLSGIIINR
jgi:hypothetical protein